jgi:lysophospholipase L1-like esterase
VVQIIEAMEAVGSRVVLVTLPGLYTTREAPTPEALETGHLPPTTDNPYEIAVMTERYDELLRELARERDLPLIDLERWADRALVPRHAWFVDSVHLTEEGQALIGAYMAEQLAPRIRAQDAAAASRDR